MKKRISLLLCMLIAVLGLAGCSGKNESGTYDKDTLESSAEFIISNFSQMGEEEFEQFETLTDYQLDYTMMQAGLKISGRDFIGMINSWEAAENECGEYVSHGDYEIKVKTKEIVVSTLAKYEEREATIAFTFDADMTMESMDVSAKYSTGEILTKAGLNTVLGMGVTFAVLIFLAFLISLMKYIPEIMERSGHKETVKEEKPAVAETIAPMKTVADDLELIAVITAAIAAAEGTGTDGFVVRSVRRRPSNNW